MFQLIRCKVCGTSKNLEIKFTRHFGWKTCKHCSRFEAIERTWEFCSIKCLKAFLKKLEGHKHIFSKDRNSLPYHYCKICGLFKEEIKHIKVKK